MFWKVYDHIINVGGLIAAALIALIAFGVTIDVTIRYLFGATLGWMLEVSEYAMFAATMLGTAWVLREGGHTSIDLVVSSLSEKTRRIASRLANLIGLSTCLFFGWFALLASIKSFRSGTMIYKSVVFPEWWLMALIIVAMASLALGFLRSMLGGDSGSGPRQPVH
jgi:TRAP-type transport system small permease protein